MKKWIQTSLCIGALSALSGCSSIVDDDRQVMTVKTVPAGAHCTLKNLEGEFVVASSPGPVTIETACDELTIICKKDGYKVANSNIQDAHKDIVWGNVIFGGVIGYAVDRSSGAACHYPSSVTVTLEELRCRTRVLRKILDLRSSPSAPPRSPTRERPRRCPLRKGTLAGQSDVSDTPSFKSWQDSGRVRPRHK